MKNSFKRHAQILLDNPVDVSVFHHILLSHLDLGQRDVKISGMDRRQLVVKQTGYLEGFFMVYASEGVAANVFSMADVEDIYRVTYVAQENFMPAGLHRQGNSMWQIGMSSLSRLQWHRMRLCTLELKLNEQEKPMSFSMQVATLHRMRPGTCSVMGTSTVSHS